MDSKIIPYLCHFDSYKGLHIPISTPLFNCFLLLRHFHFASFKFIVHLIAKSLQSSNSFLNICFTLMLSHKPDVHLMSLLPLQLLITLEPQICLNHSFGICVTSESNAIPNLLWVELSPPLALTDTFKDLCFCCSLAWLMFPVYGFVGFIPSGLISGIANTLKSYPHKWAGTPPPDATASIKNRTPYVFPFLGKPIDGQSMFQ